MNLDHFITSNYYSIMTSEVKTSERTWHIPDVKTIACLASQLEEYAKNGLVLRSYNSIYGLTKDEVAFESTGAHTNLMRAIVDRALSYLYGPELERNNIPGGYSYREVIEAASRHDLPENRTGDLPDNGNRDEEAKLREEHKYQKEFSFNSPKYENAFERNVKKLLLEMDSQSSEIGRLLYLADKVSAILIVLTYDEIGSPPMLSRESADVSDRDLAEMSLCDAHDGTFYYASEMWTLDYLFGRKLVRFDDDGFFTSLIVMYTLMVKHHWYAWRTAQYHTS